MRVNEHGKWGSVNIRDATSFIEVLEESTKKECELILHTVDWYGLAMILKSLGDTKPPQTRDHRISRIIRKILG